MEQTINYKCRECNRIRKTNFNEIHQICYPCYKARKLVQSGNKTIDDFIKFTQTNRTISCGKMKFVPYDKFKDLEFIAEGGFSKVYKATWINASSKYKTVALKKLNNSKNIGSKELNEV